MSSPQPSQDPLQVLPETEPTEPTVIKTETPDDKESGDAKRSKKAPVAKKPSAEVLQRRKEGRIKAAATIAQNLKKTGIGRFEQQNGFGLTSVRPIPLINQKNYFTEYLRKDEQISFIRNWRTEKYLQQKLKNNGQSENTAAKGDGANNFDDFDLNDIEAEMNKKKIATTEADDEEEEDDEENETEETREEKAKIGHDTIIIHPGSSYLRIGRATDAVPVTIPTVIAIPRKNESKQSNREPLPTRTVNENGETTFGSDFEEHKSVVTKDFKARMRFYKRRILPNSREAAANYNKKQEPERIADHNDPYKKEWIDVNSPEFKTKKFFVGDEALKLPLNPKNFDSWLLRYPIINGNFNEHSEDYNSPQEILGDIANIVVEALNQLDIKNLSQLKAMLVIPDLYDKVYVETWVDTLFKFVGFGRVGILQEAVAATFGAGATCACVVDVGAQTTSISCVDEGMIITDSRVHLNFGGDQITETFMKFLLESSFPYKNIDLGSRLDDWELAQSLKHNFATFQDADIAVQLYNFYKRKPSETTEKYEFKVFDEVMLAPLGLFYPDLFQIDKAKPSIPSLASSALPNNTYIKRLFPPSVDHYSGKSNNPTSKSQDDLKTKLAYSDQTEEDLLIKLAENRLFKPAPNQLLSKALKKDIHNVPLEKAIIESITNAGLATDLSKVKKFYDNLLIVGGGFAKIPGYDLILSDRINIWRPKLLSNSALDQIVTYVLAEIKKVEEAKKQMIHDLKSSKRESPEKPLDDIELTEAEIAEIESKTQVNLDLDYVDSLCDQGQVLPVNVLPPPREFDPEMLTWKGGSVYGRLKVVNEMWITQNDWDLLQSRCLYYKSIFNY
ncbi:actin-related protein [Suhomyces tanzawaensis NRRL Y-17324]|uniref:Actin-related protein n=1 Tax=Suhomyces tanzawaensis NRRL Y-17324 TaxID=984487 RepID=A0A1E4SDL6_9ASCO|nr:actin-related protein [Suhomyces tanzawaensis NRRL Y-17324]ODV77573.1 actin-related protein [Suhomyces tanzawaensis NRRL Y-17324]